MKASANQRRPRPGRRIPVTKPYTHGGAKPTSSRALHTSRARRGPFLNPATKSGGLAAGETSLESLIVDAANLDPRVRAVRSHSTVMDVRTGVTGANRDEVIAQLRQQGRSAKDAVLWYVDVDLDLIDCIAPTLVEVKPAALAQTDTVSRKLTEREAACRRVGFGFACLVDDDFGPHLARNVRILRRYQRHYVAQAVADLVVCTVEQEGPMTVAVLSKRCGAGVADIYALISSASIAADLRDELLTTGAIVRPAGNCTLHILNLPD